MPTVRVRHCKVTGEEMMGRRCITADRRCARSLGGRISAFDFVGGMRKLTLVRGTLLINAPEQREMWYY